MPRFAANLSMLFTEVPFLERFERAAHAGFEAVEFLFPYACTVEAIQDRLNATGLKIVLHNLPAGDWDELYFRDYLCINVKAAARYAALKMRLMRPYEHDRDAYTAAKGGFIRKCTARARALWPEKHLL